MKILFVEQQYVGGPLWDGVGAITIDLTRQLSAAGHEVHVLSCLPGQTPRDEVIDGVFVHYRGEVRLRGGWRLLSLPGVRNLHELLLRRGGEVPQWLRLSASTYLEFRRLGIDVDVIEASTYPRSTVCFALFQPSPLVLTAHLPGWQAITSFLGRDLGEDDESAEPPYPLFQRLGNAVTRFQAKRAAAFMVPSRLVADAYAHEPVYADMVQDMQVIPYSIEPGPWLSTPDVRHTARVVLQVGRLEARKASEVLVDAGALLAPHFPDLEVVFVGRSFGTREGLPYVDWLRKRAEDTGSPCRFVPEAAHEQLLHWHGRARVVALPSWFDTYPIAGIEALAAGRPLVCTTNVGYAGMVEAAGAGAVVPPGDGGALAAALRPYLEDADVAHEAGSAGRRLVATGALSAAASLSERLKVYERAVEKATA